MLKKVQTRMKAEDRERQLLAVAQSMFIERGYQGTAMEDIAKAAGVTRPVVYKLFGNKDTIYLTCLKKALFDFCTIVGPQSLALQLKQPMRCDSTR